LIKGIWSEENPNGFYPANGYYNTFFKSDISSLDAGNYEFTAQWKVNSTSYQVNWYGNYDGEIKLIAEIYSGI